MLRKEKAHKSEDCLKATQLKNKIIHLEKK